jgi:hypothetical protein
MPKLLVTVLVVVTLAMLATGCATTTQDSSGARVRPPQATPFESWAEGNGTGSFFRPLGPAQGTGVRHAWPE